MKAKSMLTKVSLLNSNLDFEHEKGGKIERMFTALMIYTLLFPITNIRSSAHVFFFGGLEPTGVATILMLMKKGKEKKRKNTKGFREKATMIIANCKTMRTKFSEKDFRTTAANNKMKKIKFKKE